MAPTSLHSLRWKGRPNRPRARWGIVDVVGLGVVAIAGVLVLIPALVHGASLGPYDILEFHSGLNKVPEPQGPQLIDLGPDLTVHPLDEPGVDPSASGPSAAVEPIQRVRDAAGLQLGVGSLQPPRPGRVRVPVRLAYTAEVIVTVLIVVRASTCSGSCCASGRSGASWGRSPSS